jgi:hypothetical protein
MNAAAIPPNAARRSMFKEVLERSTEAGANAAAVAMKEAKMASFILNF